jgi:cell shape-determining protein MreC
MLDMETSNYESLSRENENLKKEVLSLRTKQEAYENLQEAVKSIKSELDGLINKEAKLLRK